MSNLVFVRLRPLQAQEKEACVTNPAKDSKILTAKGIDGKSEEFSYDKVLGSDAGQNDVFEVFMFA